jgi:hypothetical protein
VRSGLEPWRTMRSSYVPVEGSTLRMQLSIGSNVVIATGVSHTVEEIAASAFRAEAR